MQLAALTPETHAAIDAQKMFSRIGNPLDMGIFGGMRRSAEVPTLLMADPGVSVGLALVHSMNPWQGDPYRAAMGQAREVSDKPLLVVTPGGMPEAERQTYAAAGIDVFTDTDILLEGDRRAADRRRRSRCPNGTAGAPAILPRRATDRTGKPALLAGYRRAHGADDRVRLGRRCVAAATRLGYPVVLKGVAEGVAHKSDLGLVHVGLRDPDAVARAYAAIGCPQVIVQAMIAGDLEAIAGVTRADGVGLVLIAGLGGIFAEALHDVSPSAARSAARVHRGRAGERQPGPGPGQPAMETSRSRDGIRRPADGLQAAALALGDGCRRSTSTRSSWAGPAPSRSMRWWCRGHERPVHRHLPCAQHAPRRSRPGRRASRSSRVSRCRWPRSTTQTVLTDIVGAVEAIDDLGDGAVRGSDRPGRPQRSATMPASS